MPVFFSMPFTQESTECLCQAFFLTGQNYYGYVELFIKIQLGTFSYAANIILLLSHHCTCSTQQITIKFPLYQMVYKS